MNNNNLLFKKGIYISVIVFSICFFSMFALLPSVMFDGGTEECAGLFVIVCILLAISSLLIFALSIIMIVKICSFNDISSSDKIIWSLLSYFANTFALAFAYEKFISRTNDFKSATKLAIFHGISLVLSVTFYIIFFISMADKLNF